MFPFSLNLANMDVNLMIRNLLAEESRPLVRQQDYQFIVGEIVNVNEECDPKRRLSECWEPAERRLSDSGAAESAAGLVRSVRYAVLGRVGGACQECQRELARVFRSDGARGNVDVAALTGYWFEELREGIGDNIGNAREFALQSGDTFNVVA